MKNIILLSLTFLLALCSFSAQAESWGFLAGMHRWEIKEETGLTYPDSPKFSSLFGVALFHQSYPLELDLLYTKKEISQWNMTENSLQIPFLYRANITKELLFGIGGFFDYDMTDKPHASGRQKLDIGVATSLKYQVPFGKSLLAFDARYLFGTTDLPGKSRDIVLLVGLLFK